MWFKNKTLILLAISFILLIASFVYKNNNSETVTCTVGVKCPIGTHGIRFFTDGAQVYKAEFNKNNIDEKSKEYCESKKLEDKAPPSNWTMISNGCR